MIGHHAAPDPGHSPHQAVLNESWPLRDEKGPHARGIKDRTPIPVHVRIVFERDGEQWLDGNADRWHGCSVHVAVHDSRLIVGGVWVDADDVRRRDDAGSRAPAAAAR